MQYTGRARLDNYGVNMGLNQIFFKEEQIGFKIDPWDSFHLPPASRLKLNTAGVGRMELVMKIIWRQFFANSLCAVSNSWKGFMKEAA